MNLIQEITIPDDKDLFIVGDIHGAYALYKAGSRMLGIKDEDVVISLGDLTDRGNENLKCVVEFTRKPNRYAIRGNHEDMLIKGMLEGSPEYYECWYRNGGHTVWEELGEQGVTLLATMVEKLPVILIAKYRGKTLAFIHGGYPSAYEYLPLSDIAKFTEALPEFKINQFAESLMWDRDMVECASEGMKLPNILGADLVFHGHSYVKDPLINGNRIYMDTGGFFNNNLTFAYFDGAGELRFYSTAEDL